jgi:hypothetical protein
LDGSYRKWYGDSGAPGPDFSNPQPVRYLGGSPGAITGAQWIPGDFDGNGRSDFLVYRTSDGAYWKAYGDSGSPAPDLAFQPVRYAGDAPGVVTGATPARSDFNGDLRSDVLLSRSSDGAFWKWYSDGPGIGPDFTFPYAPRYLGGSPGAVGGAQMIPIDFNGDGKTDMLIFRASDGAYWKWYGP